MNGDNKSKISLTDLQSHSWLLLETLRDNLCT